MKKISIVLLSSLLFLFCTSLISFCLKIFNFTNAWIPVIIGSVAILLSLGLLVVYLKVKKQFVLYLIFGFNILAMSFLIRSWHIYRGYNLELYVLLLVSLVCTAYLLFYYLLSYIPLFTKHFKLYLFIFMGLSITAYIILIFTTKTNYISTLGYYMIIELGFLLALSTYTDNKNSLLKAISFSTYLVIVVAIIIIIIMLDGEPDFDLMDGGLDLMSPREQLKAKTNQAVIE